MTERRHCLPEHDLMVHLVSGKRSSEDAIQFARELDKYSATRWLCYYHPGVDMVEMDIASIPAVKRAIDEKRKELFGDNPKNKAMVSASKATDQYFDFWERYDRGFTRSFHNLDEAYDWLGLSEEARAAASAIIQNFNAEVAASAT